MLRFFLLAQETAQRVLQVRFLLLAISIISLIALDCLKQGVLNVTGDSAPTSGRNTGFEVLPVIRKGKPLLWAEAETPVRLPKRLLAVPESFTSILKSSELSPEITPLPVTMPSDGTSRTMLSALMPSGATRKAELNVWISVSVLDFIAAESGDRAKLGAKVITGKMRAFNF